MSGRCSVSMSREGKSSISRPLCSTEGALSSTLSTRVLRSHTGQNKQKEKPIEAGEAKQQKEPKPKEAKQQEEPKEAGEAKMGMPNELQRILAMQNLGLELEIEEMWLYWRNQKPTFRQFYVICGASIILSTGKSSVDAADLAIKIWDIFTAEASNVRLEDLSKLSLKDFGISVFFVFLCFLMYLLLCLCSVIRAYFLYFCVF